MRALATPLRSIDVVRMYNITVISTVCIHMQNEQQNSSLEW